MLRIFKPKYNLSMIKMSEINSRNSWPNLTHIGKLEEMVIVFLEPWLLDAWLLLNSPP